MSGLFNIRKVANTERAKSSTALFNAPNTSSVSWNSISGKPSCFTPCLHNISLVQGNSTGYAYWDNSTGLWSFNSISGGVTSFNGRTGAVTPQSGDYTTTIVAEGTNLYFTTARVLATALTGLSITGSSVVSTDTVLQAFGKLQNQVNALVGGVNYQGTWDANINSPAILSGVGTKGYYYVVSVAGSTNIDGITDWKLGDWIIFNGTVWEKVDNTDAVVSVNGYTGIVTLAYADLGVVPATLGGTGIANNVASTLTISGNYATTFTVSGARNYTFQNNNYTIAGTNISNTFSAAQIVSVNGAASTPALSLTGTWFSGGTSTTTKPQLFVESSAVTVSTGWSTNGTALGINSAAAFTGLLVDAQVNGTRYFAVNYQGRAAFQGNAIGSYGISTNSITFNTLVANSSTSTIEASATSAKWQYKSYTGANNGGTWEFAGGSDMTSTSTGSTFSTVLFNHGIASTTNANGANFCQIRIKSTLNQTGTAFGNWYFIDYDPTVTSLLGTHYGIVLRPRCYSGFNEAAPTALVHIGAVTAASASLRITAGSGVTAPSVPNSGDIWHEGTNNRLMFYKGAASVEIVTSDATTGAAAAAAGSIRIQIGATNYDLLYK